MEVLFFGQPFSEQDRLGLVLGDALEDAESFWSITAWAHESGLSELEIAIRGLRAKGGAASAIVGVDGGIATREALELVADLFDPAFVFHDTGNRTFHPKVYCVERSDLAVVGIGSSNFTGGGLLGNYEANVVFRLDPSEAADAELLTGVRRYRDRLTADGMPCEPLTPALIERMASEESLVSTRQRREEERRSRRGKAESIAREIFGEPVSGLPPLPRAPVRRRAQPPRDEAHAVVAEQEPTPADVDAIAQSAGPISARWWKELTASDVLRKPETSHQRNYVALSQAGHAIDFTTWFRQTFFTGVTWTEQEMRSGAIKEVAEVPFNVFIEDEYLGRYEIRVDHAETRIANQGNSPTYLNWSSMIDVIRESDFRDWWLELTRFADGHLRLRLLREEPVL